MKEVFRTIAVDETENWNSDLLAKYHIAVAFGIYVFREGEATHCCSMSPDSWAIAIANEFIFDFDLDPSLRAKVIDEAFASGNPMNYDVLEQVRQKPGDDGLSHEELEDCYLSYIDVKNYNPRLISGPVTFTFKARDYKGGSRGDAYHDAIWDTAREYFSGNAIYPDIICNDVYLENEAENIAKRRAVNMPIIPTSYRSEDHMPLFDAAARRMLESELVNLGWFSPWVIGHYNRHPDELAHADMIRAGQIAGYLER